MMSSFAKVFRVLAVLLVCFGFFSVFFKDAKAANEVTANVVGGPFSLASAWGGIFNVSGSPADVQPIAAQYTAGTAEGSLVILPGSKLSFSSAPTDLLGTLRGGLFGGESVAGKWAASLSDRSQCSANPIVFSVGADQYSFVLCGVNPAFSLSSDNATAMSCSGMTCTANAVGNARITATIAGAPVKVWGIKSGEVNWTELVSATLPGTTLSWDTKVVLPPTLTFSMSGTNPIPNNTSTTLSWSAQNVVASNPCVASGDWSGTKSASGTYDTGNLQARRDYTLTCTGPSGDTVKGTVTVLVGAPVPGPTVVFSVGSTLVLSGTSTTLSWDSPNADTCTAIGSDWTNPGPGSRPTTGSQSTGPVTSSETYILQCSNSGGTTPRSLTVDVLPSASAPFFRSFTASPNPIAYNAATTLSWDVQNATSCTASSDAATPFANWNGGGFSPAGSRTISGITSTTKFSLSCMGTAGTTPGSVDVFVAPAGLNPPTITLQADNSPIPYNTPATIRWSTVQADICETGPDPAVGGDDGWWHLEDDGKPHLSGNYTSGNLTTTTVFELTCSNMLYTVSKSVTVKVNESSNPVTLTFTADKTVVAYDTGATLQWQSTNATTCTAQGPWPNGLAGTWTDGTKFTDSVSTGNLQSDVTYVLTCQNSSGPPVSRSVTITIDSNTIPPPAPPLPPAPIVSLQEDSSFVAYNTGTTLRWSVQNATSCTAYADPILSSWMGEKGSVSGTAFTGNLQQDTIFHLQCWGPGGMGEDWTQVNVGNSSLSEPSLSFWADDFSVLSGGSTTLRWKSTGAVGQCRASGDWLGNKGLSSSASGVPTGALTTPKTYRLTCSNAGGSITATVNVLIGSTDPTASLSLWVDNSVVPVGGSTMLRWNAQNVTACVASAVGDPAQSALWSGPVSFVGGKSTGPLTVNEEYTLTCTGASGEIIVAKTRVGAGATFALPLEIQLYAEAGAIPSGTPPVFHLTAYYYTACRTASGWLKNEILPSTSMTFDSSYVGVITMPTTYTVECTDADDPLSPSAVWGSASVPIRIVQVLLCPASSPVVNPGDTVQFSAWYTEDASVTCSTDESLRGTNVTDSGIYDTLWSVVSGGVSPVAGNPGMFRGDSFGPAVVRAQHRPAAASVYFPGETGVIVARRIDCYRCDSPSSSCSSRANYSVNNTDTCSTFNDFDSMMSCRFACFKNRWQEVAP